MTTNQNKRTGAAALVAITALSLTLNGQAENKQQKGAQDFEALWIEALEPKEPTEKSGCVRDIIEFHRLGDVYDKIVSRMAERIENAKGDDYELLGSAFDLLLASKSPEDLEAGIASRLDRTLERLRNDYSPSSGQNDRVDAAIRRDHNPFLSTRADLQKRGDALLESLGGISDPLAIDPLRASDPGPYKPPSDERLANMSVGEVIREMIKRAESELDEAHANFDYVFDTYPEGAEREKTLEEIQLEIELSEHEVDVYYAMLEEELGMYEMPNPEDFGSGELHPVARHLLRLKRFVERPMENDTVAAHIWGLINPGPDGDQGDLPDPTRPEYRRGNLDPYINPGEDHIDEENLDVPDEFEPRPIIDNFGGAVDPERPTSRSKGKASDSGKNFGSLSVLQNALR